MTHSQGGLRARVTVKEGRCFGQLLSILAPFAFEFVVRVADRPLIQFEELPEVVPTEVPQNVLPFVYYASGEGLFV